MLRKIILPIPIVDWSVDRQTWIAAGDLQIGEQVKTTDTTLALSNKVYLGDSYTVYNLEIYREHNYLVGEDGVLVCYYN